MNREIKFRIWDIRLKTFLPIQNNDAFRLYYFINRPEEYIVQQFTGLKDKNDKDIYEGDILELTFDAMGIRNERGEPVFMVGSGNEEWFERKKNIEVKFEFNKNSIYLDLERYMDTIVPNRKSLVYKVIGNIFESPNLLV